MTAFEQAKERALRYLNYRDRTYQEVTEKLTAENFAPDIIEAVVTLLRSYKLLDDARYAAAYVNDRLVYGGFGLEKIKYELQQKGVDPLLIEEAIQNADERAAAAKILAARLRGGSIAQPQKPKWIQFLLRRGFSYDTVSQVLETYGLDYGE
jgi:regulatory protein